MPDATQKRAIVRELAGGASRRLLFTRTKHQARRLARELTADGVPAVELHGNLSQNARERGLQAFADGRVKVMVATDIAARGIHVDDVDLVVHVDPPAEHKAYLHRSGRTARAGNDGDVVTLVLPEQRKDFAGLARAAKITVQPMPVSPGDRRVTDVAGAASPLVAKADLPAEAAQAGPKQAQGAGRPGASKTGTGKTGGSRRPRSSQPAQREQASGRRRSRGSRSTAGSR